MTKASQTSPKRPDGEASPASTESRASDLFAATMALHLQGLERLSRLSEGCMRFGASRYARDTAFWADVARAKSPGDVAVLWTAFLRTAQHDYLEEANRQVKDLARETTVMVSDMQSRFEEVETTIDHASAQAGTLAV